MYTSTATYENKPDTINFGVNTDHLGNVRAVVSDIRQPVDNDGDGETDEYQADVKFYADYYPYGMLQPGRSFNAGDYRFGFGSYEKDDEIAGSGNYYNMGARLYDPRIARTPTRDPMWKNFPSESNYIYAGNNPIFYSDIDGKYKYPKNKAKEYTKDYPMLTKYLAKNVKNDVMNSAIIKQAMLKYTEGNLTEGEIEKATTWGEKGSPTIVYNPDLKVDKGGKVGFFGRYDPETNTINISKDLADKVESILQDDGSDKEKKAALYEYFATLTHETVHHGDYLDDEGQEGEPGAAFMREVFESIEIEADGKTFNIVIGSVHGESKEIIEKQEESGKSEIIPTLPEEDK